MDNILSLITKTYYKKVFINGAFIATFFVAITSIIFNISINNPLNLKISFLYLALLLISFFIYQKNKNIYFAALSIFWISSFIEAFFLFQKTDINLIYVILLPIIIYTILPFRKLIFNLFLFYLLIFFVLLYEYNNNLDGFLHNKKYLYNFITANLIILFYGILYNLVINRFIYHLEKLNSQKNILLKEVHHRVKNNLNLISSIIGLSSLKSQNKEAKTILEANKHRIKAMAILHEMVYKNFKIQKVELKNYIKELTKYLLEAEDHTKDKNFEVKLNIDKIDIGIDITVLFGIMINELITNSIKHSLCKDQKCLIEISFLKRKNGYEFIYTDNTQKVDKKRLNSGFGSDLINLIITQLQGEVKIDTTKGLIYKIFFDNEAVDSWQS